ncbi:hypothetical protein [Empedobacter tilapiae]|uniref:Uncharacterized protein n=1 Tax=Empedobacter tilapiae TaxID=2491114 RepID=A0A4Z1B9F7_9FLAO|nr:hypothetical protein [Empedobacter tilapiae]TGN21659.1 hypothetical protein E4J94_17070 [Empedobacter tilapiae]
MKFIKGCLLTLLIFITAITSLIYFYNLKLSKELIKENEKTKNSLLAYKDKMSERNKLILNSDVSDSLKVLAKKSDSIIKNSNKINDNLWTEYKINQKLYDDKKFKKLNEELNEKYSQYNSDAQQFNFRWLSFPLNIVLSNNNLRSYDNMYTIDYGIDNSENMIKRKKVDHWIETGEVTK